MLRVLYCVPNIEHCTRRCTLRCNALHAPPDSAATRYPVSRGARAKVSGLAGEAGQSGDDGCNSQVAMRA